MTQLQKGQEVVAGVISLIYARCGSLTARFESVSLKQNAKHPTRLAALLTSNPRDYVMNRVSRYALLLASIVAASPVLAAENLLVFEGGEGPGKGKHVVLVSGDEEYRSEEMLPQLGKILAKRHGYNCTVLFAIDPKTGEINPNISNIPGLDQLDKADLLILFTRFRNLPDDQMKHLVDYIEAGKPIMGLRTATHAFSNAKSKLYGKYTWNNPDKSYKGGFGRQVLGETWVSHHGGHGREATRGILAKEAAGDPILKGIKDGDIFGPSDVYGVNLPDDAKPLVLGQVVAGMKPSDPPVEGKKNDPMMPVAWKRVLKKENGKEQRVFTATVANGQDFSSEGLRRLLVNAAYWATGLEDRIPVASEVGLVGEYNPPPFGNNRFRKGLKPVDHQVK